MRKSEKPTIQRVKFAFAAMLLTVLGVGNVQAQCSGIFESSFTFDVYHSTTANTEIQWTFEDDNDSFSDEVAFYFTNTATSTTYRFVSMAEDPNTGYLRTSELPAGNYTWYVRAYCTEGDSSAAMEMAPLEITEGSSCSFSVSDFDVNASDGSDDMPYDDYVELDYYGSEALDSIHFIITETTSGWTDSTNVTYDVDESRWYVQFGYLTAGDYTISLRPYCSGQASTLLTNGNTWSFTIECTPENASPVIDDIEFTPVCSGTTEVTLTTSSTCGTADNLEFYIDDPDWENGADNYDGTYENVTPGEHIFTVVNVNNSRTADTTITISSATTCEAVLAGSSELSISGFSYEDYDNTGNFGDFYYVVNIPTINGDYVAVEAQYYKIGTTDTNSAYLDMGTGRTTLNIPINAKGDWVVRMRARCCGYNPGNIPSAWLLTDTIHHYPDFTVESVTGACSGNDAQATVRFRHPFNKSSSNIGVRIFPVDDPSDITFTQTGVSGSTIELGSLAAGDYKMYVYITDGTDENTYNAYLDTIFTIGTKIKVTIENDSSKICWNDSITYRAIPTGGSSPYSYRWYNLDTDHGTDDSMVFTGSNYYSVEVTDNNGCVATVTPTFSTYSIYNGYWMNGTDGYVYDTLFLHVARNQCPLTMNSFTWVCDDYSWEGEANIKTTNGCDSVKWVELHYQDDYTAIFPNRTLDTTVSNITLVDDGYNYGLYTLNSESVAIVRASNQNSLVRLDHFFSQLTENDTVYVYQGAGVNESNLLYTHTGTATQADRTYLLNSNAVTVRLVTGSEQPSHDSDHGMGSIRISFKSADQLEITPICTNSGSVKVTNPARGFYYCLTKPDSTTDTIYCYSTDQDITFSGLEEDEYTLRSYVLIDDTYESTNQDTTFTIGTKIALASEGDSAKVCGNETHVLRVTPSGGTAPYTYLWYYDGDYPNLGETDTFDISTFEVTYIYVQVTDAGGCTTEKEFNWEFLDAYTQERQNLYDDYSYDEQADPFKVPQNLCPLTRFGVTYDCSVGDVTMDVNFQSVDGCDSIKQIHFYTEDRIGIPGGGTLDTTISSEITLIDDGGGCGYYSLNSHGKAIVRAAGGERDKLIVYVSNPGALSDEDTLRIYKEESEMAVGYNREGTWNLPNSDTRFMVSSGVVTVNFYTGSKRGFIDDYLGYWKGYRMEQVSIWVKSPDQLAVTPICGGSGSVQVTNPTGGVYYCLTNPGGTTDTIYSYSSSDNITFSNLTESGSYTLRSYVKIDDNYESTNHDTTFTIPAGSFELSVEGDSTTVCSVNPNVTLTASVTGGEAPYAYSWSDGTTDASITVSEAYTSPSVTVTDNTGCSITYATNLSWIDYVESEDYEEASVCEGTETYTWGSTTVTISDEHLGDGYYIYYDTVESAGTCPTIAELHLTVKPNATIEEHVVAWGSSYTWAVDGASYTTNLGGYSDTVDGCPVTVAYDNEAAIATHSGAAANGCDSIYTLNLTLIDGIPIPATGTTDTTLATMVEGDTVWVYDDGGMLGNYSLEQNGMLILRAPEGYTLQVVAKEINVGDGDKVNLFATENDAHYYTYDYFDNNGGMTAYDYFENNGTPSGRPYVSVSRDLYMKFYINDSVVAKGFKLAVTLKSLDDTCLAVYNVEELSWTDLYEKTITWQHEGSVEGYRVKIGRTDGEVYFDTIVTDTFITVNHEWISPANTNFYFNCWAVCGANDNSYIHSMSLSDQCGIRPGLADGEMYTAPATFNWSEPSNNNFELYGDMPPCWSRGAGSYTRPDTNLTYPMLDDVFGGDANWMALYFYTNADNDQYAAMPKFDTIYGAMNTWALNFTLELADYNHGTECEVYAPVVLYVGVMSDPNDASTFTTVDTIYAYSNDFAEEANKDYYVSLAGYSGSGLYPAFKMARRETNNPYNEYTNHTLMLYDVMVVPDGGLEAPSNVTVTKDPTDDGKAVISWTEPAWPQYNDDYSPSYVIELTNTSGTTFTLTADYDATSSTFDATAGEQYRIKLYYKVTSARYSSSWMITDGNIYSYERPLYEHLTVDTIGDLSFENLISNRMPFEYGNDLSTEILVKSNEIDATAIDAIAFRMPNGNCVTGGESFQNVKIYMKDVTLTELDASNMTADYLFDEATDLVVSQTSTRGGIGGWLTFTLDSTFTHDPDKNILIGVASWGGDHAEYYSGNTRFHMDDNSTSNLALSFEGVTDLTSMPASHDQYYRPQMKLIGKNNCTNDTLVVDTNLCENASLDWRGMTISFSDPDIESHKVQISTYNYIYVYTDKVEEVTASGCDSIYKLQITKRYNEDNNYDVEDYTLPHVTSCGPYTWRNGETYDYSMGTYTYDNGGCTAYGSYGPRVYDTVPGVTAYGCDSIYGLNLTVDPWYTVVFDTTGVDAGTGMEPVYRCEGSDYTLPECTMTVAYKSFVRWEIDGEEWYPDEDYPYDDLSGDTLYITPVFECLASVDTAVYADFCPNGGYYTWRGNIITTAYAIAHGHETTINGVEAIEFRDTIFYSVGSVCDSVYLLQMIMDNKLDVDEMDACEATGLTWIDGNHYDSDFGWVWIDDDDDGYRSFDMSTAASFVDSTANDGCGKLHMLSLEITDESDEEDTIYFIRYYKENTSNLDTLHSMTMYVCDGYQYFAPECPDTVTREGYDFVIWSDNPACGWTVEPGEVKTADSRKIYLYGMWESNCEDKEAYDTTMICSNDTVVWNGFTWNGPELEFGEWDTTMTKVGVIPGECDSIFYLHVTVPSVPMISVTGQEDPLCYGDLNGWISVAVEDGNAPYQYALGDSNYTAALDTTGYKFENLAAGGHMVWVKDACGVTDNIEVTITEPTGIMILTMQELDSVVCHGTSYSVNLLVSGGTVGDSIPYTYLWNSDSNYMEDYLAINTNETGIHNDTVLVTDANGCTATASYTTEVRDSLAVTILGNDTTYCYGATAVPLTVTVTGGDTNSGYTYQWYNYGTAIEGATGNSYTVPTNTSMQYDNITVMVDNICGAEWATAPVITVLDSFYVGPLSEINSTYCFGANASQIEVPVNGGGAYSGQWYMNGTAVTDHNDGDAANKYTPRTDTAGTFNYSLKIASNAGCGSDSVTIGTIRVYEPFAINVFAHDTSYCYGVQADTIAISLTGFDEEGNSLISWYAINGTDTTSVNNDTPYNSTYVPPTTTAGTTRYIVIADGGCGVDTAEVATITVRNALEVNVEEQSNIYCLNSDADTLTLEGQISGNGSYEYQWYAVTGETNEIIDTLTGATNIWYVPATNEPGDVEYRVKVTDLTCGFDTTVSVGSIYTSDSIRITSSIDSLYACPGSEAGSFSVTYEGDGEIDYCWYSNGVEVYRNVENEFMPSSDSAGVFNFYLVLRSGYGCASDSVVAGVLTVYDEMTVTVANQDTAYCYGATADTLRVTNIANGSGNFTYRWMQNGDMVSENEATFVPSTTEVGATTYSVTVMDNDCGTDTTVTVATITVHEGFIANIIDQPSLGYVCIHSDVDTLYVEAAGGSGNYNYLWYVERDSVGGRRDTIEGATDYFYKPTTDTAGTVYYYVNVTDANGCGDTTVGSNLWMRVNDTINIPADQILVFDSNYCLGDSASYLWVGATGCLGALTLDWYVNGVLDTTITGNNQYTPSTAATGIFDISVVARDEGPGCGSDSTHVTTITVGEYYTANFVSDEADTNFMSDISVCSLTPELVLPENEYEYDMHEFIGWYNQSTADTVQPGDTVTLEGDVTFNTVWRALCRNVDTISYAEMCDGDTITWRGYTVTSAQTEYFDTIAGVVDVLCDSVYHLLLTVNYPTTSDTTILACDSIWWNNMFFTETPDTTQSYFMARANQYGCDSTAYLNLTVNYSIHDYVVETACDSYVFDSVTYTESTDLPTIGDIAENGCPFITHISLTVNYSYHGEDSATACDLYVWNDMELEEGGDHDYVGYTSDGCDSVVTLHLTMHYTAYGMDTQTACDSLVWIDGNTYFSDFPGDVAEITYLFPGASMYGCDSVAVLDLTMEDHIYVEFISDFGEGTMDEMSSCIGKPFTIPQCEYVNEGFVFNGWTNQVVHDTVMPGDTVFLEESTSFIAAWVPLCEDVLAFTDTALCEGSTFVWRGHDYTNELYSGDYEDVAYGVIENYCDSIYYLRLTVYPVSYNEFYDSVVGSVIWYDEEYTTTGDYSRFCGYNRYGCDSTEVLHLIVNLSIDDKDGMIDVKVYPNPTQGIVNLDGVEIRRIAVLDQVGRTVATFDDTNRIDISDLPAGIYTLYLQTSAGDTTRRVVKR